MNTILLLVLSNVFMTFAWYGHLKYGHEWPLWKAIVVSWAIALLEYCLAVPANRLGYGQFSGFQLKIIQEVVTLRRLHRIRDRVSEGETRVELFSGVRLSCRRCVLRFCVQGARICRLNDHVGRHELDAGQSLFSLYVAENWRLHEETCSQVTVTDITCHA